MDKNYECKLHQEHITKPPDANHGTHLAFGCKLYKPKDKTAELIGQLMPTQCCMCINFGIVEDGK